MGIIWLHETRAQRPELVGGKAATLSLLAADYTVPPGFCIGFQPVAFQVDDALREDVASAYAELSNRCGLKDVPVAVRSSAFGEDGREASFAGQYQTFLHVTGERALIEAVGHCFASVTTPLALAYRARQRDAREAIFAVLVQRLVLADVSAVAFSVNPVTGSPDEVLINANWGLGESVVGVSVTPDSFSVRKSDGRILSRQIAMKERMTVLVANGTRDAPVPTRQQRVPSLADSQVVQIADLCMSLEARMGFPVDLECAFENGTLFLLQCRRVTAF